MSDDEFVAAFEDCSLPLESFRHADHVRMAFLYLGKVRDCVWEDEPLQRNHHLGLSAPYSGAIGAGGTSPELGGICGL